MEDGYYVTIYCIYKCSNFRYRYIVKLMVIYTFNVDFLLDAMINLTSLSEMPPLDPLSMRDFSCIFLVEDIVDVILHLIVRNSVLERIFIRSSGLEMVVSSYFLCVI